MSGSSGSVGGASSALPAKGEVSALILGAGNGVRMGSCPKALLKAGGMTLVERAVARVQDFASEVVVGVAEPDVARVRRLLDGTGAVVLAGGASRQETFERLLERATGSMVLLHEVARPLAPPGLFASVLAAAMADDAATPYLPISRRDAVFLKDGDFLDSPLQRDDAVATQTPQAYRTDMLIEACRIANEQGWEEASVATLCMRIGRRVRLVPGDPENLKITYSDDWKAVRCRLLKRGQRSRAEAAAV